ncbi:MAG: hypothetical protein IPI05_12360 [Flavobacteriales bacterium]|nr:hypothetical protein [Flavobacteriales bacterium]
MIGKKSVLLLLGVVVASFLACRKDHPEEPVPSTPPTPTSPVVFNLDSVPYSTLSHYNFFEGPLAEMQPVQGVLPYELITPLFTDYVHKLRYVWMPAGSKASYVSDGEVFDFPEGAVIIKNFYYDNVQPGNTRRILETRLMIKKYGAWIFADYVWNDDQTEAVYNLSGSYVPLTWNDAGGQGHDEIYRIPSEAECFTCHKYYDQPIPIGPKPQNMNSTMNYADGPMNQLAKWEAEGYLQSGYPTNIETVAKWDDPNETVERRVRAYLDINCAHCHSTGRHCDYRPIRFDWNLTTDPVNLGVCVPPDDPIQPSQQYIVYAGNKARSMLYFRMSSNEEAERMPLMGRTVRHEEAIALIGQWIDAMPDTCQ